MSVTVVVRGVTATLNDTELGFACEGDPIPDATWDGPRGVDEETGRPKSHVSLPENFQATGFADELCLALEEALA